MHPPAFAAGLPGPAVGKAVAVSAVLVLVGGCSRATAPSPSPAPESEASPSLPTNVAAAHLARGVAARERQDWSRARDELEQARALFEKERSWEGYVRARNLLAAVARGRADYKAALEHANAALTTAKERLPPGHVEIARSYLEIGSVYSAIGRNTESLELLTKALALRRAAGSDPKEEADILLHTALARINLGEDEQGLVLLEEAEAILRKAPGRHEPDLADVLIGKGSALWGQGRYDAAIAVQEQAVAMLEGLKDARGGSLAAALLNIGNSYWSKSDYDEALAFYGRAVPLQVATRGETHPVVGATYMNRAILHLARGGRGDYDDAIADGERALRILVSALGERNAEVIQTYNVIGSAHTKKGDPARALAVLEKARILQESLPEKNDRNSAVIYSSLGEAYQAKGALDEAARNHRRALAIDRATYGNRHPDLAEDLLNLGELCLRRGQAKEALSWFAQAIAANDPKLTKADPDLDPPFDTAFSEDLLLKALKGSARARGGPKGTTRRDLEAAARVYANATRLIERMRAGYHAEGSKLSLAASATETFDEAIRTELELYRLTGEERHREEAYRYAERSKAGILRDALNEAEARSFAGIPDALLQEERQLRLDLAAADHRLNQALEDGADEGGLQALREKRFGLTRRYEALQQRFEKEFPEYYELKYRFETAASAEVRAQALDGLTALVEYFLGHEEIFIFTLIAQDLEVTRVPREASLEADLRKLRSAIVAQDDAVYLRSAERLYRVLLGPVEGRLEGKDLVIVPDGPLHAVPFEALLERPKGSRPDDAGALPYVLRDHAVSYAYSATVLVQALRHRQEGPRDEFVGFAPAFDEGSASAGAPPPLPASRKEVIDVDRLFRKRAGLFGGWLSGRSRIYLGRDATKAGLRSAGLERYRFVHLATHGILDEDRPALSRLLLQPDRSSGEAGALTLGEIYNLRLNADLVVLSACDTGAGRIARGEGIIGLTRGFLFAGARSLLVSLWPVSDDATAALVVEFYAELLRGRPKAQALREAKLRTMGRNPEYAKPFYWSPLVLVGDRR